ncbi:MAG TPA: hypothetical protein VN711_00530 [Candidatus Saccharimonadales bacterium]|nr:hypothetical protein [Candidatus Saccharimonadales bacterium]
MLHKIIKKAGPELHIFMNSVVLLFCVILIAMVGYLVFKHLALKSAMYRFVAQGEIASKLRYVGAASTEDAQLVATTVGTVPSDKPLYTDKMELEKYIATLAKQSGRDIVVLDTHEMILADSIPANIGKTYTYANGADLQTMKDGQSRDFKERSTDYPDEIEQVVVPVKSSTGTIVGALIMSTSHVFDN